MLIFLSAFIVKVTIFPESPSLDMETVPQETIFIPRGATLREVADILEKQRLISNKTLFVFLGKVSGYENKIKAGLFKVPLDLHPWPLIQYLVKPLNADIKVTIPEGSTAIQIASIFRQRLDIDSTEFMHLVQDSAFCHSLGVHANDLEGYLMPETYYLAWGMSADEVIRMLVQNTLSIFKPDSVHIQMLHLDMNRQQVLTLASIVEGEVLVDSERVLVSSVYHNRLEKGWLLQADPTIQYILPDGPRRLYLKDLEIDSPYNTYKYRGLPPGPINNPGARSILAALFPAKTPYMYFVATGDGGHHFSTTASEHSRWKARFDRVRRKYRRH